MFDSFLFGGFMKQFFSWLAASAAVMFVLPWLAVTFVKGDGGMAVCFLLFFALDPLYAIVSGACAGRDPKRLWALPLLTAILFLAGAWLSFDMGETAFVLYAAVYLALGTAAMLICMFIRANFIKGENSP